MSTTSERLGEQAKEVTEDIQKMGGTVKDAAQEKFGQVVEEASEYCEQGREKVHGSARLAVSNFSGKGRWRPYCSPSASAGCSVAFGSSADCVSDTRGVSARQLGGGVFPGGRDPWRKHRQFRAGSLPCSS